MTDYTKTDPITTQKLPPNPDATVRSTISYPYIGGSEGYYGEQNIYSQFGPINTAFTQSTDINSGYHIRENTQSGTSVIHDFKNAHEFSYTAGGYSKHSDGNRSVSTKGQSHHVVSGSKGTEVGKDIHEGSAGSKLSGTGGDGMFENHTGGNKFIATSGDQIALHDGNQHMAVNGDMVMAVSSNKYDTVNGEYGIFIQQGNFDVHAQGGNVQVSAVQTITVTSNTTLKFVCGTSSIIMNQSGVTINSPNITINGTSALTVESGGSIGIQASGSITTQGSATLIQGGGSTAPPTTFQ